MKIDIGPDGKILGTKRVSPNGQISGFTEYAGQDVLVILPGGRVPVVRRQPSDLLVEAEALVRQRMELAFRQYRHLRSRFPTPEDAARSFLAHVPGSSVHGLVERADAWLRDQLQTLGRRDRPARKPRTSKRTV